MSEEIQATVRILELTARGIHESIRIGAGISKRAVQLFQAIHHAHIIEKGGELTYRQLLRHVGGDTRIINFATENKEDLQHFKKELADYHVRFCMLPDLSPGDGYTQFMIDVSDTSKVNGFLESHQQRFFSGFMSPDEYDASADPKVREEIVEKAVKNIKKENTPSADNPVPKKTLEEMRRKDVFFRASSAGMAELVNLNKEDIVFRGEHSIGFFIGEKTAVMIPKDYLKDRGKTFLAAIPDDKDFRVIDLAEKKTWETISGADRISLSTLDRMVHQELMKGSRLKHSILKRGQMMAEKSPEAVVGFEPNVEKEIAVSHDGTEKVLH